MDNEKKNIETQTSTMFAMLSVLIIPYLKRNPTIPLFGSFFTSSILEEE